MMFSILLLVALVPIVTVQSVASTGMFELYSHLCDQDKFLSFAFSSFCSGLVTGTTVRSFDRRLSLTESEVEFVFYSSSRAFGYVDKKYVLHTHALRAERSSRSFISYNLASTCNHVIELGANCTILASCPTFHKIPLPEFALCVVELSRARVRVNKSHDMGQYHFYQRVGDEKIFHMPYTIPEYNFLAFRNISYAKEIHGVVFNFNNLYNYHMHVDRLVYFDSVPDGYDYACIQRETGIYGRYNFFDNTSSTCLFSTPLWSRLVCGAFSGSPTPCYGVFGLPKISNVTQFIPFGPQDVPLDDLCRDYAPQNVVLTPKFPTLSPPGPTEKLPVDPAPYVDALMMFLNASVHSPLYVNMTCPLPTFPPVHPTSPAVDFTALGVYFDQLNDRADARGAAFLTGLKGSFNGTSSSVSSPLVNGDSLLDALLAFLNATDNHPFRINLTLPAASAPVVQFSSPALDLSPIGRFLDKFNTRADNRVSALIGAIRNALHSTIFRVGNAIRTGDDVPLLIRLAQDSKINCVCNLTCPDPPSSQNLTVTMEPNSTRVLMDDVLHQFYFLLTGDTSEFREMRRSKRSITSWLAGALATLFEPFFNVLISFVDDIMSVMLDFFLSFEPLLEKILDTLESKLEQLLKLVFRFLKFLASLLHRLLLLVDSEFLFVEYLLLSLFVHWRFRSSLLTLVFLVSLLLLFGFGRPYPSLLSHLGAFHNLTDGAVSRLQLMYVSNFTLFRNGTHLEFVGLPGARPFRYVPWANTTAFFMDYYNATMEAAAVSVANTRSALELKIQNTPQIP